MPTKKVSCPRTRKPTAYNRFVSKRMSAMSSSMSFVQKIRKIASEWRSCRCPTKGQKKGTCKK